MIQTILISFLTLSILYSTSVNATCLILKSAPFSIRDISFDSPHLFQAIPHDQRERRHWIFREFKTEFNEMLDSGFTNTDTLKALKYVLMKSKKTGDLYIFIEVAEHELFERDGPHLYCRAHVPMTTAALGGEVEIPTIDGGRSKIKIPDGSQTGKRMRLRGKGMSVLRSSQRGDMYVELSVETPSKLNARQRELTQVGREFLPERAEWAAPRCDHPPSKPAWPHNSTPRHKRLR